MHKNKQLHVLSKNQKHKQTQNKSNDTQIWANTVTQVSNKPRYPLMQVSNKPRYRLMGNWFSSCCMPRPPLAMFTFSISKHHPPLKPPTNQTHKPRKIIKPTWKKKPRNLKQTTTQIEKQTQVREIVTNTNRSVTYMPQPSDGAPHVVTLILGNGIKPLVTGAMERRRMLRESWRNRFGTMRLRLSWRSSRFGHRGLANLWVSKD